MRARWFAEEHSEDLHADPADIVRYFDRALIDATTREWESPFDILARCKLSSPLFLIVRLRKLVEGGMLDGRGELTLQTAMEDRVRRLSTVPR